MGERKRHKPKKKELGKKEDTRFQRTLESGDVQRLPSMTRNRIVFRPKGSLSRRQPLLNQSLSSTVNSRFAEVAGGMTAECAAIACCCPCGLANLVVLVVYRVPAGLCRRALRQRHRRHRLMKKGLLPLPPSSSGEDSVDGSAEEWGEVEVELVVESELLELEKEMWDHFYSGGFWRSPSRIER